MLTLEQLKVEAKETANDWEIDWDVLDSSIAAHEDFKKLLSWADTFDLEAAESVYQKLCNAVNGESYITDDSGEFDFSSIDPAVYLDECGKIIREAIILRDLHERYNLIMEITKENDL